MSQPDMPETPIERAGQRLVDADTLERVAKRISATLYDNSLSIGKGYRPANYITYDDMDLLREVAKHLRGYL